MSSDTETTLSCLGTGPAAPAMDPWLRIETQRNRIAMLIDQLPAAGLIYIERQAERLVEEFGVMK